MKINEIFLSVDGEVNRWGQGLPTVFVRTSGCNLNCSYCDTKYHKHGREMGIGDVVDEVIKYDPVRKVTITGGEPLLWQDEISALVHNLKGLDPRYRISIETNGTKLVNSYLFMECCIVADYKLPGSGCESEDTIYKLAFLLSENNFAKFVITSKEDFERALEVMNEIKEDPYYESFEIIGKFAMSPVIPDSLMSDFSVQELVEGMAKHCPDCVLNVQIHKFVGLK